MGTCLRPSDGLENVTCDRCKKFKTRELCLGCRRGAVTGVTSVCDVRHARVRKVGPSSNGLHFTVDFVQRRQSLGDGCFATRCRQRLARKIENQRIEQKSGAALESMED